ncbi:phosducin-like protein 2 isoform X2 [Ascaphus truei]|uniref:phosducin-like protein 2 isoform X2 n=1 Tax=Ascaphus truei TaxID=8439 RepID=UPI003F5A6A9D
MVLQMQKEAAVKPYEKMTLGDLKKTEDEFDEEDERVIEMYSISMCLLLNHHLSLLAKKFPETKFLKAIVDGCVQNYHDRYLPTLFIYRNGQIEGKFIGVEECGGTSLNLEELEWKLAKVGAVKSDMEEDPKKEIVDMMMSSIKHNSIHCKDAELDN